MQGKPNQVSVSYRGATFLNYGKICDNNQRNYVSVPYRGATFLNRSNNINILHTSVSVPYRGATFLNFDTHYNLIERKEKSFRPLSGSYISQYFCWYFNNFYLWPVSVPYRGATFLNGETADIKAMYKSMFPSPIGELHFSIAELHLLYNIYISFPSPIGELHFSIKRQRNS